MCTTDVLYATAHREALVGWTLIANKHPSNGEPATSGSAPSSAKTFTINCSARGWQ